MQGPLTAREVEQHLAVLGTTHGPIEPQHPIVEYFVAEVLQLQPEALQLFLLRTSILSRLTGPLCDVLMGRATARRCWMQWSARASFWNR